MLSIEAGQRRPLAQDLLLVAGASAMTVFLNFQDIQTDYDAINYKFTHPLVQAAILFLSQILCLVIYQTKTKCRKMHKVHTKRQEAEMKQYGLQTRVPKK